MTVPELSNPPTLMLREIREQPTVLQVALDAAVEPARRVAEVVAKRDIDLILIAARGTSDHAALYGQYLFQYLNGIPVALATPSLFTIYGGALRLTHAMVIGISQSGQAPDIVEVLAKSRQAGAFTVSITNFADSPLAHAADETLLCHAGVEQSVAATKTYTTTCALLASLAAALQGGDAFGAYIAQLPTLVSAALNVEEVIVRGVDRYVHVNDCIVLGRGFEYSTARETALKLEETCYVIAPPFSTADFRHGPAALVERGVPVMLFASPGRTSQEAYELAQWLREQGADSVIVAEEERLLALATTPIQLRLPSLSGASGAHTGQKDPARVDERELLAPFAYIVPGQLFAHYLALGKGLDPDRPRGLSKVTRTL